MLKIDFAVALFLIVAKFTVWSCKILPIWLISYVTVDAPI